MKKLDLSHFNYSALSCMSKITTLALKRNLNSQPVVQRGNIYFNILPR